MRIVRMSWDIVIAVLCWYQGVRFSWCYSLCLQAAHCTPKNACSPITPTIRKMKALSITRATSRMAFSVGGSRENLRFCCSHDNVEEIC